MIHVHECGVLHQDLKAENCLTSKFDPTGVVKLIAFGASKLRSSEMGSNFKTRNRRTRAWMAPEVIENQGDKLKLHTWSADVYSHAMTCYEILTGEIPFGTLKGHAWVDMVCTVYHSR